MNQGKIWRVVKPTIGVPLFLTAVAVSSFTVHYMLLSHTTWLPKYYEGGAGKVKAAAAESTTSVAAATPAAPPKQ